MDPVGVWVVARGDGEFRRVDGEWVHAAGGGSWAGLPVPGARDVTLEELHGHRMVRLDVDDHAHWRLGPTGMYVLLDDARTFAELDWAHTKDQLRHPRLGTLSGFPVAEWDRRRTAVVGLWAPEILRGDIRAAIAAAGLDERAATRGARSSSGYRRALLRRGAGVFGLTHRELAAAAGISRGRISQILDEPGQEGAAAARSAASAQQVLERLVRAAAAHDRVFVRLEAMRAARARMVVEAREQGLTLSEIAECLGVTRGRVHAMLTRPAVLRVKHGVGAGARQTNAP
jgi:plasmid maintenance system antidote protein VapI